MGGVKRWMGMVKCKRVSEVVETASLHSQIAPHRARHISALRVAQLPSCAGLPELLDKLPARQLLCAWRQLRQRRGHSRGRGKLQRPSAPVHVCRESGGRTAGGSLLVDAPVLLAGLCVWRCWIDCQELAWFSHPGSQFLDSVVICSPRNSSE